MPKLLPVHNHFTEFSVKGNQMKLQATYTVNISE